MPMSDGRTGRGDGSRWRAFHPCAGVCSFHKATIEVGREDGDLNKLNVQTKVDARVTLRDLVPLRISIARSRNAIVLEQASRWPSSFRDCQLYGKWTGC
jgi:hypothetical protein